MKLSKAFINMMRRKSVHINMSENREKLIYEGDYISVIFSTSEEYDCLNIEIVKHKTDFMIFEFGDYVNELNVSKSIIDYAEVIFEVEKINRSNG